ncbi:MAG TPA: M28 family peptidase [Pyrinomonadaceae bacterium]|nr:M28 family peptidase [Acidobacteriota bacterium]HQZ96973.1 M28 family peptidase [Pyrinomonadaceae bacterium]
MKKIAFIFALLAIAQVSIFAQNSEIPSSKLFDSKQLLRDVEVLAADDMEGRGFGTPGGTKAREYVVKRFKESGLADIDGKNLQPFSITGRDKVERQGANVYGVIRGTKHPEKYIVISAHYDHVGTRNGEVYNGADDDASGTAALFAMASYFKKKKPQTSLLFVAFDAEESGLVGSKKFVSEPPVPAARIVMNINMDMVGHSDKNELYASGSYHNPFLKPYIEPLVKDAKVKLLFGHDTPEQKRDDWTFQSDHGSFHREKIPFIYFGVEDHKDYHKPTDDYPTLTKPFYVHSVETVLAAVKVFDQNAAAIKTGK